MDENFSIENLNTAERIELAIKESRRQQARIAELINSNMNETRPVVIEENRKEIERLTEYHKEYDEMTKNGYLRYMNNLNDIINRLTVEKAELSLSDKKEIMLRRATEQRNRLLELSRDNMDILFYIQPDKKSASVNPHSPKNPEKNRDPKSPEAIEENIRYFNKSCDKIENDIVKILKSLVYEDKYKEVTSLITKLDEEFAELKKLADKLREEIGEFKDAHFGKENFSLSITEIDAKLKEFRTKLRKIKKTQVEHYNDKVNNVNDRINNLKSQINNSNLSEEDRKIINDLEIMPEAYGSYNLGHLKYLSRINYGQLLENIKNIELIEKKLSVIQKSDLDEDIEKIEKLVHDIGNDIKEKMTQDEINELFEKIGVASYLVIIFTNKLEADKDKITEEQYNAYVERINKAKEELDKLREKIGKIQLSGKDNVNHDFEGLKRELDLLEAQIDTFSMTKRPQSIVEDDVPNLEGDLNNFETSLEDISKRIEEKHNEGKIDDNQFNTLMEQVKRIEEKIEKTRAKLNDPEYVKNYDIFERIKNLELNIDELKKFIDSLDDPIKDKKIRKKIDKEFARLEAEIKALRVAAETLKEEQPDKYDDAIKEIDKQEKRLNKIAKDYREKCPFLVKKAKSAKNFYKEHKKAILISAGLASLILIHATVGPVIGPALIQGNLMLMNKIPMLSPLFKPINLALAQLVGAKEVVLANGARVFQLLNGQIINPSCAAVSLLKGAGLVLGGSTAMFGAPLLLTIKGLTTKMKKHELNNKLSEKYNGVKEKISTTKEKVTNSYNEQKDKLKDKVTKRKKDQEDLKKMKELLVNSGLSYEELASILDEHDESRTGGRK